MSEPTRGPRPARLTPIAVLALAMVAGTGFIAALGAVPIAMRVFAVSMLVLAVARCVGADERTRLARSRWFDVTALVLLAVAVGYLSFGPDL